MDTFELRKVVYFRPTQCVDEEMEEHLFMIDHMQKPLGILNVNDCT